jgi:hypothetical protein
MSKLILLQIMQNHQTKNCVSGQGFSFLVLMREGSGFRLKMVKLALKCDAQFAIIRLFQKHVHLIIAILG